MVLKNNACSVHSKRLFYIPYFAVVIGSNMTAYKVVQFWTIYPRTIKQ